MSLIVVINHLFVSFLISPGQLEHVGAGWLIDVFRWSPLGVAMDGMRAVYVFFTISGIALTYPILRARQPDRMLVGMAVYRYPRLVVPILASGLIVWALLATGSMTNIEASRHNAAPGWYSTIYAFPADLFVMLKFSLWDVFGYVPSQESWNNVLWTMPVELFGSFMLFVLLAFVRWRWLRLIIICGPGAYWALTVNNGYYAGFFGGRTAGGNSGRRRVLRALTPSSCCRLTSGLVLPRRGAWPFDLRTDGGLRPTARRLFETNTTWLRPSR